MKGRHNSIHEIALIAKIVLFAAALILFTCAFALSLSSTKQLAVPEQVSSTPLPASASTTTASGRVTVSSVPPKVSRGGGLSCQTPLRFEMNQGQTGASVRFLARGYKYNLFLTSNEAVLALDRNTSDRHRASNNNSTIKRGRRHEAKDTGPDVITMRLAGARTPPRVEGEDELPGRVNYFIGNDQANWRTDIPTYAKVRYQNVYPGIDLIYYGRPRTLEYDFVVAPGSDPKSIKLLLRGTNKIEHDPHGDLILDTGSGELRLRQPEIYQVKNGKREQVSGAYVLRGKNEIGFRVGNYDRNRTLIIDPVLSYSTYLGGSNDDAAAGIAIDSQGNAYVAGETFSTNFPTAMAFQSSLRGSQDAFVTKFDPSGAIAYSTYLGGDQTDNAISVAVDSSGNAYVTGSTDSANFPTTTGAFQSSCVPLATNSSFCADTIGFVTKLSATGNSLVYSTYVSAAAPSGIAVDSSGNAYVTGQTGSIDFPTVNAIQAALAGHVFFKSTNGGSSWQQAVNNLPNRETHVIALDPNNSGTIYLGLIDGSLFKSTDGGATWIEKDQGLPGHPISAIAIDSSNSSTVYVAPDDTHFAFDPTKTFGVYKSTDGGTTWNVANTGLTEHGVQTLATDPKTPTTVYAGVLSDIHHARLFKSTDSGATWSTLSSGFPDNGQGGVDHLLIDPKTPTNLFCLYSIYQLTGGVEFLQAITVFKSTDSGATWTRSDSGIPSLILNNLGIDPSTPTTLYATYDSTPGLVKSANSAGSWTVVGNGLPGSCNLLAVNPSTPSTLYVGTVGSGLFKSTDGGMNVSALSVTDTSAQNIETLAVDPVNTSIVYAGSDLQPDAFVLKLNPAGTALVYSTYLGGDDVENGLGIAVDPTGDAYVTGNTASTNFPVAQAFQSTLHGLGSAFVTKLNAAGSAFVYSTYLGGTRNRNGDPAGQNGSGIAADASGNAYVAGSTTAVDFPAVNAFQPSLNGFFDAFVTKFNSSGSVTYSTYLGGSALTVLLVLPPTLLGTLR